MVDRYGLTLAAILFSANYQLSDNNFTYGIGFLIRESECLDTKIAFVLHSYHCESISAAILDCEGSTGGILVDL